MRVDRAEAPFLRPRLEKKRAEPVPAPEARPEKPPEPPRKPRVFGELGEAACNLAAPAAVIAIPAALGPRRNPPPAPARPRQHEEKPPRAPAKKARKVPPRGRRPLAGKRREVSAKEGEGKEGVAERTEPPRPLAPRREAPPGGPGRHRVRSVGNPGWSISASEGLT